MEQKTAERGRGDGGEGHIPKNGARGGRSIIASSKAICLAELRRSHCFVHILHEIAAINEVLVRLSILNCWMRAF